MKRRYRPAPPRLVAHEEEFEFAQMCDMTVEDDRELYSVAHAIRFAQAKVAYCDRMTAEYPDANLGKLRARASTLLGILERQPGDLARIRDLLDDLRKGKDGEGTGWSMLLGYVEAYLGRLEKGGR